MEIRIGDKYAKTFVISEVMINGFAVCTGDKNPVHLDDTFASKTVFKKRIAHGFLIGSLISSVLGNDYPGNGTIYLSQNMRFLKPVFIGDKIEVSVVVIDFTEKNWVNLKTICINQDSKIVIDGDATIIPPTHCELIK
jgi:3-hydroxybutyryl-CoA dehydratase